MVCPPFVTLMNHSLYGCCGSRVFRFKVLYNYNPHNEDELELTEGDTIDVMEQCDDGWFVGRTVRLMVDSGTSERGCEPHGGQHGPQREAVRLMVDNIDLRERL